MLINFATTFDSKDVHLWSGLGYYMGKMLETQGHEVNYLNDLPIPFELLHTTRKHLERKVFQRNYSPNFNHGVAQKYAREIKSRLATGSLILTPNTILLSKLGSEYKKVLFTDATFRLLHNFYPAFTNIPPRYVKEADEIEASALHNADLLIYSSQWAADSAIRDYGVSPGKIAIVPFGSNLDTRLSRNDVDHVITSRDERTEINLLLLAVSWYRKGGDYALQVVTALNRLGYPAKLHIVGMRSLPGDIDKTHIIDHGYVSKSTPAGQRYIIKLMKQCDFLLLPSRADCTPVAVSEANSFALPAILSNVGGNSAVVTPGVNGHIFDFSKGVDETVHYIRYHMDAPDAYSSLCHSSYQQYLSELNWNSSGKKITGLLKALVGHSRIPVS